MRPYEGTIERRKLVAAPAPLLGGALGHQDGVGDDHLRGRGVQAAEEGAEAG